MGVCTNRQWQTSSRLVQELNVCIVDENQIIQKDIIQNINFIYLNVKYPLKFTEKTDNFTTHFKSALLEKVFYNNHTKVLIVL